MFDASMNNFENVDFNYANWTKWSKQLNNFIVAQGIGEDNDIRRKAVLLHYAGNKVNEIYDTLAADTDTYKQTVDKVSEYLKPCKNIAFDRNNFRSIVQHENESMKDYVIRLRQAGNCCAFDDYSLEQAIIEQIVSKCTSPSLRKKLLELGSGKTLTLDIVSEAASIREQTERQLSEMTVESHYQQDSINLASTSSRRGHPTVNQRHLNRVSRPQSKKVATPENHPYPPIQKMRVPAVDTLSTRIGMTVQQLDKPATLAERLTITAACADQRMRDASLTKESTSSRTTAKLSSPAACVT